MGDKKSVKRGNKPKDSKGTFAFSFKFLAWFLVCGIFSAVLFKWWNKTSPGSAERSAITAKSKSLKYWGVCIWEWNENGNLRTMNRVFERLGFDSVDPLKGDDWDVLWSIEYPYSEDKRQHYEPLFKGLKPHQRINHFPGIHYMTSKFYMVINNQHEFDFLLKSFIFPENIENFKAFTAENPNKTFVHKNLDNRGVKIVKKEEIDFESTTLFYQEFMGKPFLIDDRAFDVGIFVLISSINPLRIYRYNNEVLLRFCPEPYYPFDPLNIEKYVIHETHKHFFDMPSLNPQHQKFGYSFKDVLADHLKQRGHSWKVLEAKMDNAIVKLITKLEPTFLEKTLEVFNTTHHFFEIVRFDFILDEALNIYLMEVNSSPNLTPMFKKFENNSASNEQLVHEVLNLVGASNELDLKSGYNPEVSKMVSSLKNIAVDLPKCVVHNCDNEGSCSLPECQLCTPCVDADNLSNMHRAYREHIRRGGFNRLFPSGHFNEAFIEKLSPRNQISAKWFKAKCDNNKDWC